MGWPVFVRLQHHLAYYRNGAQSFRTMVRFCQFSPDFGLGPDSNPCPGPDPGSRPGQGLQSQLKAFKSTSCLLRRANRGLGPFSVLNGHFPATRSKTFQQAPRPAETRQPRPFQHFQTPFPTSSRKNFFMSYFRAFSGQGHIPNSSICYRNGTKTLSPSTSSSWLARSKPADFQMQANSV